MAGVCMSRFTFNSSVVPEKLPIKLDIGPFKTVALATLLATGSESFEQILVFSFVGFCCKCLAFFGPAVSEMFTYYAAAVFVHDDSPCILLTCSTFVP